MKITPMATPRPPAAGEEAFIVREAVAVFHGEQSLMRAVDALETAGFDRADISVLGGETTRDAVLRGASRVEALEDDGTVPRAALVTPEERAEAEAATVGLPLYAGAIGGLFVAFASGGTLAFAIPAAIGGGLAGGGLGALGALVIAGRHRRSVERRVAEGGHLLWVRTPDWEQEEQALRVLRGAGGADAHIHEVAIRWGPDEVPFAHLQPDPLLERGQDYD